MATSSVIARPAGAVDEMLHRMPGDRCACCGGPTLPVIEWRGEFAVCHRCARWCESTAGKFTHRIRARIDRESVDRIWAIDLGFKKLGR